MFKIIQKYFSQKSAYLISLGILFFVSYLLVVLFPTKARLVTAEDGFVENIGAAFFLVTSICLFWAFIKTLKLKKDNHDHLNKQKIWLLLLFLVFLVAFGEEISWGQRIFNYRTPETVRQVNAQGEFNIHNYSRFHGRNEDGSHKTGLSSMFTMHSLFYQALITYMVILPVLALFNKRIGSMIEYTGIPLTPLWIGVALLMGIFFSKMGEYFFAKGVWEFSHSLVEVRETNIALVVMLMGFSFMKNPKGEKLL